MIFVEKYNGWDLEEKKIGTKNIQASQIRCNVNCRENILGFVEIIQ